MAEVNLGRVKGEPGLDGRDGRDGRDGEEVTKINVTAALGFTVKDTVFLTQKDYDKLSQSEKEETIYFIKDVFGKVMYEDEQIWDITNIPIPTPGWDGTFADPLVGQILFDEGLIADATKSSEEELAGITSIGSIFEGTEITSFDELQYFTGVTSLGVNCFGYCPSLTSIVIPDNVTSLGDACFGACPSLTSIVIPNNVTSLGYGCFGECSSLTSITIPDSVRSLGYYCFYGCSNLTSITLESIIPPTIVSSFDSAVQNFFVPDGSVAAYKAATKWSALADKIFPMSTIIFADPLVGQILFDAELIENPTYSTKVELGLITELERTFMQEEITKFPELQYCISLVSMNYTFAYCSNLTKAPIIPDSVTSMSATFAACENLTEVPVIPNSVTDMVGTFTQCTSLIKAPIIPDSVTNMESTFELCSSLVEAPIIPNSVTNMESTFRECSLIEAPVIPNSVTNLYYAFFECTSLIKAPIIPNSVTNLSHTFRGCTSLNGKFIVEAVTPPTITSYTFEDVNVVSIKVPAQSVQAYKTASGWSDYADKIFPIE